MAREVTISSWCDICLREEDQRVEAVWLQSIALGEAKKNLDLCNRHAEELLVPLARYLDLYGVGVEAKPPIHERARPGKGEHLCPACEKPYTYRTSLTSHTLRVHNRSLVELEAEAGLMPPGKAEGHPCGEEGCDYVARNPQGRGAHRRAAHGIQGSSPAVVYARRMAEQREKAPQAQDEPAALIEAAG